MLWFDEEFIQAARCLFLVGEKQCLLQSSILFYCSSALIPNSMEMDLDLDLEEVDFLAH